MLLALNDEINKHFGLLDPTKDLQSNKDYLLPYKPCCAIHIKHVQHYHITHFLILYMYIVNVLLSQITRMYFSNELF